MSSEFFYVYKDIVITRWRNFYFCEWSIYRWACCGLSSLVHFFFKSLIYRVDTLFWGVLLYALALCRVMFSITFQVMDFMNDAVATFDAFTTAYKPSALYFCQPFEMWYILFEVLRSHKSIILNSWLFPFISSVMETRNYYHPLQGCMIHCCQYFNKGLLILYNRM